MEYELAEPFEVDDESLASATAAECFALGVEWAMFRAKLKMGRPFSDLVMEKNAGRLARMAERCQRFVEHYPPCDGWCRITVGDQLV